jgi:hypothetical protein
MIQQLPAGQSLFIVEASRSHSDTIHSVGLLWTSDYPDNTQFSKQTSMPPAEFEPAIPENAMPQTHALDRSDAGTGNT